MIRNEIEEYLQLWIIGMQKNGVPVSRDMIIMKVNDIYCLMYKTMISTGFLGLGWLDTFMNRHQFLTSRPSKIIKIVWSEATVSGLYILK